MWITRLALWKWVTQYFPARLVVSKELERWAREQGQEVGEEGAAIQLPTSVNYLLGYHPHGPVAMGMLMAYGNDLLNFSKVFPDIKTHIATLNVHYKVPFYREYAMLGGGVSVSQESLIYLLDKEVTGRTGNLVAVSVGGAIEALESRPGHYVLMLSRRRGFFRIALRTGAYLIPSIGFGETSMYDQVANPTGSALRKLQDWFTHTFTLAPPLFYSTRVIPYRKPLTVVVGRPIICRRVPHPTDEEIDNLREQYKQQLREIFNRYRPLYDPTAEDIRFY
ncbi:2-acylglycerol O-acyltransferase 2 [Echinococcus granulosus]|nr:2-acylglycerol O-acyltransferase 2 [Echinococcus granulosus]